MATFNTYRTTFNGEPEIHQNKRDAFRAARAEANNTGKPVKVEQHRRRTMNVITWQARSSTGNIDTTVELCVRHSADEAKLPSALPRPVSVSHGQHPGVCEACEELRTLYFVVAAPGHYGDRTRVVSSHRTLTGAKKNATAGYVVREGEVAKGAEFTRSDEQVYPII